MNRKTGLFSYFSRPRVGKDRSGYTLLEILVAVSLMLMLMYAVAAIFARVGTIMNQTQGAMTLASGLRDTARRLEVDLKQVSVPLIPPRNSRNNEGYFCIVEGMGGSFQRILGTTGEVNGGTNFAGTDIAWDLERSGSASIEVKTDGFAANGSVACDTTVGDTDDILMFTAKAPAGQFFRGRFISPVYNAGNKITGVNSEIIESEYAEIIWFLRGTTLYRRVLLIIPQEKLEEGLKAADWLAWNYGYSITPQEVKPGGSVPTSLTRTWQPASGTYSGTHISPVRLGYGFFKFFDVSVHLERFDNPTAFQFQNLLPNDPTGTYVYYKNGKQCRELERVVANTPGDLSNRKNRYGYWNSVCGTDANNASYVDVGNMQGLGKLHGNYGAWYWLRLPTLQESATFRPSTQSWNNLSGYLHSFRAGVPFGGMLDGSYWRGINQTLEAAYTPVTSFTTTANVYLGGNALPLTPLFDSNGVVTTRYPFLDFWNNPNCWEQVSRESGDLLYSQAGFNSGDMGSSNNSQANLNSDTRTNTWGGGQGETYSQDVILTNVLSFNVKVWDDSTRQFVEMGGQFSLGSFWDHLTQFASANTDHVSYLSSFHKDFKTIGFYRPFNFTNNKTVNNSNGSHILAPFLPAVYDTWTEQYELEWLYNYKVNNGVTYSPEQNLSDIPTEGSIPSVVLTHFPPPYDLPLKAVQIELRAFDPKLKIIRNMTFQVDFPSF